MDRCIRMNKYDKTTRKIIEDYLCNMIGGGFDDRPIIISGWLLENFNIIRKNKYVIKQ